MDSRSTQELVHIALTQDEENEETAEYINRGWEAITALQRRGTPHVFEAAFDYVQLHRSQSGSVPEAGDASRATT